MRNILFSADHHANHSNIIIYANRPFLKREDTYKDENGNIRWVSKNTSYIRAKEMNHILIKDWNNVVGPEDVVYHLGDFSFGDPTDFIYALNGKIILIPGNHDKDILDFCYHNTTPNKIRVMGGLPVRGDKVFTIGEIEAYNQTISMSHFALEVWNKSHRGAWHLFGHSHASLKESDNKCAMDVGVDAHYKRFGNFSPFSFDEIKKIMSTRKFVPVDHHKNPDE